ncbi:MAG: hypothetical protein K5923_05830 [Clostridia bacterium]|nr:hypothetical protein [Clostridia bacterium]
MDLKTIEVAFSEFNDKRMENIVGVDDLTIEEISEKVKNVCSDLNNIYNRFNSNNSPYYIAEIDKQFKNSCAILKSTIKRIDEIRLDWLDIKTNTKLALTLYNIQADILAVFE